MDCKLQNVQLPDNLRKDVEFVSKGNESKMRVLAPYVVSKDFKKYVESQLKLTDLNINNVNANTRRSLLRKFYQKRHSRVENYHRDELKELSHGFTTPQAYYVAKRHVANMITLGYHKLINGRKLTKVDKKIVLDAVVKGFVDKYNTMLEDALKNEDFKNSKEYSNTVNKIKEIKKEMSIALTKQDVEQYKSLEIKLKLIYTNIINDFGTDIEKNNIALINLLIGENGEAFLQDCVKLSKVDNIVKEFDNVTDILHAKDDAEDELDIDHPEVDSVDKMMRSFTEDQVIKGNYFNSINGTVKLYFNTIPALLNAETKEIDRNNPLGVPMIMGYEKIITAIQSFAHFDNIEEFIKSIETHAKLNKEYAGLIKVAEDMKKDPSFANKIFVQLNNPKLNKEILNIVGDDIVVAKSNAYINARESFYIQLYNDFKSYVLNNIPKEDLTAINEFIANIRKLTDKNLTEEEIVEYKNKFINDLTALINKCFYHIKDDTIDAYIKNNTDIYLAFSNIANTLKTIFENAERIKSEYENAVLNYRNKYASYMASLEWSEIYGGKKPTAPEYTALNVFDDNPALTNALNNLVNAFVNFAVVRLDLNSRNAEGNLGSDLGDNNYISNLLRQIKAGTEEDANEGLNRLAQFVSKSDYYKTTIFFEQYDSNGNLIAPGLFTYNGDKVVPTSYAKDLIDVFLFNGIKDQSTNEAVIYENMSKADFIRTSIEIFYKQRKEVAKVGKNRITTTEYFTQTPSDSPRIHTVRLPRYNTETLFSNDKVNKSHPIFINFYNQLLNELENAFKQLMKVGTIDKNGKWKAKRSINGLFDVYHHKNGKIVEKGKLLGSVFTFIRLMKVGNFDVNAEMQNQERGIPFFTGDGHLNPLYQIDKAGQGKLVLDEISKLKLEEIVSKWLSLLNKVPNNIIKRYNNVFQDTEYKTKDIQEWLFNTVLAYLNIGDLFSGDPKFYKNPQDFLKRLKEIQAGGKSYAGVNIFEELSSDIKVNRVYTLQLDDTHKVEIEIKNGFTGITVANTVKPSDDAKAIEEDLIKSMTEDFKDKYKTISKENKELIEKRAKEIAKAYSANTKTNDAQSYITLEEFIRRRYLDGTIKEYETILKALMDDSPIANIDINQLNAHIQVQKNFYFDIQYDSELGIYYARQIKNAEFVLIPKLLPKSSSLYKLYELMKEHGIDQINTAETSKAAKKNILTYWDDNGQVTDKNLEEFNKRIKKHNVKETYYYRYLYKQQDVPQHMQKTKNKIAIQLLKKLFDNADGEVKIYVDEIDRVYALNIEEDFHKFLDKVGWVVKDGKIVNKENPENAIPLSEFYALAQNEANRLGMDSNFYDYITEEADGTIMPNFINNVSSKIISIFQSLFNKNITRQKLPGWHAAQITNVGYDKKLRFHPPVKEGSDERAPYIEVMLPRWHPALPQYAPTEQLENESVEDYNNRIRKEQEEFDKALLKALENEELDLHLGYRIPTEGKQSMAILKVVGFLDASQGSTIMVPDEWVSQTGSDFDIDSIYGISYEFFYDYKNKVLKPYKYTTDADEASIKERHKQYKAYTNTKVTLEEFKTWPINKQNCRGARNNHIVSNMIKVIAHNASREENYSSSNYRNLIEARNKVDKSRQEYEKATTTDDIVVENSVYDPLTQINFMENAMAGAAIKAFSVNRDTFLSLCNRAKAMLNADINITTVYSTKDYDFNTIKQAYPDAKLEGDKIIVRHQMYGWSHNNKNVVGQLITVYGSQTTAHILDAIKEGTVFNENKYTFGTFKTLIDLGFDYETAIAWLQQPGITRIVENYYNNESIFVLSNIDPINAAIKDVAKQLGIKVGDYESIRSVIEKLNNQFGEEFKQMFNTNITISPNTIKSLVFDKEKLFKRFEQGNEKEGLLFDIYVIMQFAKVRQISNNVERLLQVSKPDKFGAKQTARETREIVKNAIEYSKANNAVGTTLQVNKRPFVDALYPGIRTENIRIEESFYKYIAAFMQYSTITSKNACSEVFLLEDERITKMIDNIEESLNIRLTNEQYKELCQFIVVYMYSQLPLFSTNTTLDKHGLFVPNTAMMEEEIKSGKDFWKSEIARIYGYTYAQTVNFKIDDINDKDKVSEKINEFAKLTPVQKVNFIKTHFSESAGIFDYIYTNSVNQREIQQKGYSTQTMKFYESNDNIEDILYKAKLDAYSKHPFIKLTILDLVKYAFVVEGYKFKKNAINKIIPNDFLKKSFADGGTQIINDLMVVFNSIDSYVYRENIIERFVRSHSSIIKTYKVKRDDKVFRAFEKYKSLIYIPNNNTSIAFLQNARMLVASESNIEKNEDSHKPLSSDNVVKYINIKDYGRTTLYKVIVNYNGIYLVPLNLLEENEFLDTSIIPENNKFNPIEYYNIVINTHGQLIADEKTAKLSEIGEISDENFKISKPKFEKIVDESDKNYFVNTLKNGVNHQFIKDIVDNINKNENGYVYVANGAREISSKLPIIGQSTIQTINGEDYKITRVKPSSAFKKYVEGKKGGAATVHNQYIADRLKENGIMLIPPYYKVEKYQEVENEDDGVRYAGSSPIESVKENVTGDIITIEDLTQHILNDIKHSSNKQNPLAQKVYESLTSKGVQLNIESSLSAFKNNIYAIASDYYRQMADQILKDLERFIKIDDRWLSIDDKNIFNYIKDNPEEIYRYIETILKARTFGTSLSALTEFDLTSVDETISNRIKTIIENINKVRDNRRVLKGMKQFFEIYLTAKSTNPLIKQRLINIRTQFNDTDLFDWLFADIAELDNAEIQAVVKEIYSIVEGEILITIPDAVNKFKERYNTILNGSNERYDPKRIIKGDKFIKEYNERFEKDKERVTTKEKEEKEKGTNRIEYWKAKLEKEIWYTENVERQLDYSYYKSKNDLMAEVLQVCPNEFLQYQILLNELYSIEPDTSGKFTEAQLQQRKNIVFKINLLTSPVEEDGTPKSDEVAIKIGVLNKYIEGVKNLNSQYFVYDPVVGFNEDLEYHLKVIRDYENQHAEEPLSERMQDKAYRDSFNWIQINTRRNVNEETLKEVNWAFTQFKDREKDSIVTALTKSHPEVKDEAGIIDGRKFTEEQVKNIKEETENKYRINYDNPQGDESLIKETVGKKYILSDKFYKELNVENAEYGEFRQQRLEIIKRINAILSKIIFNGHITTERLFTLSIEEVQELASLYEELREIRKEDTSIKEWLEANKNYMTREINRAAYERELTYFNTHKGELSRKYPNFVPLWRAIFQNEWYDHEGLIHIDPNFDIFGSYKPASSDYINHTKTTALQIIQDKVEFIPTEYYYIAMREASENGRYQEWFDANHVYNPYSRQFEPLRIWTQMRIKEDNLKKEAQNYAPIGLNRTREIKDEYKNKNHIPYHTTYRKTKDNQAKYDNKLDLTNKEKQMLQLFKEVMAQYAHSNSMKKFVSRDFVPRKRKQELNKEDLLKEISGFAGLTSSTTTDTNFDERFEYAYDRDTDFDMFQILKGKGTKREMPKPLRDAYETDAMYEERVKIVEEENKKIREENDKISIALMDDNWEEIFASYISKAIEYNVKERSKLLLYLLKEEIKSNDVYSSNSITNNLKLDRATSTDRRVKYKQEKQKRSLDVITTFGNRFIRNEFKVGSALDKYSSLLQNITSAKYMIFNVTGGISNILTGFTNIIGEKFAKEYFNSVTLNIAERRYFAAVPSIFANMYSPKALTLEDALIKKFNVVNFDDMNEWKSVPAEGNMAEYLQRARNALYGLNSSGEHIMQNIVLLAMMESNRVYLNSYGEWTIGSFANYTWDVEQNTLMELIKDNEELYMNYVAFRAKIKKDLNQLKDYAQFHKDFNEEFLRSIGDRRLMESYIEQRDKNIKLAEKEFEKNKKLIDCFELVNGFAVLTQNAPITKEMIGGFKYKVVKVNDKIHGVYHKIGAAQIEKYWFGGIVMQYHKHIYPGIMKRFRINGYYNELRSSVERGSYISLANFLATEFKQAYKDTKAAEGDHTQMLLTGMQNVFKACINTFINFRFNYKMMPEWERANCRRALGDLFGIIGAFCMALALACIDDDEVEETWWYNLMLYEADRWMTESSMYTPWGLVTEAKTMWSTPIAAWNTPGDLFKAVGLISRALMDDDFNPEYTTGRYKGRNKFHVLLEQNIPLWRNIKRLEDMNKHNQYYRINDTSTRDNMVQNIADLITD